MDTAPVILLDYQFTLVANAHERPAWMAAAGGAAFTHWIERERYREWLIPLFREAGAEVVLVTARRAVWAEPTLRHIRDQLHWQPHASHFNPDRTAAPTFKRRVLFERIFPTYGLPLERRYLAIESNKATRAMYAANGIHAEPVPAEGGRWNRLPL